jgi:hypothetical protein
MDHLSNHFHHLSLPENRRKATELPTEIVITQFWVIPQNSFFFPKIKNKKIK